MRRCALRLNKQITSCKQKKITNMSLKDIKIAILGLGYVGLPLAVEFGKHYDTLGFDINIRRVDQLRSGHDRTLETTTEELVSGWTEAGFCRGLWNECACKQPKRCDRPER